jgi:proteasome accessory factor C
MPLFRRLALQQVSWGRPSPLQEADTASIDVKLAPSGGGRELSQRLAKIETAISRRKTIEFSYYSMERDQVSDRKVDPYHLVFRNGQFYLIGYSHERDEVRVFRLSRIRGKVSYATKAEHDFAPPEDFDRRDYASRADWQMGEIDGAGRVFVRERIAWLVERTSVATVAAQGDHEDNLPVAARSMRPTTPHAPVDLVVLGWRENATLLEPEDLGEGCDRVTGAASEAPQR